MHEGVIIFIISCLFIVTLLISLMLFIIEIIIKRKVIMNYDDFIRIIDKDIKKLDINNKNNTDKEKGKFIDIIL